MAKRGHRLPLRRQREGTEDALLIRSAESLGRMIGALQRQLDGAAKKLSGAGVRRILGGESPDNTAAPAAKAADNGGRKKTARPTTAKGSRKSAAKPSAAKATAAKKTAGRGRSGAARKTSKGGGSR